MHRPEKSGLCAPSPSTHEISRREAFQAAARCSPPVLSGVDHGPPRLVPRVLHPGPVRTSSPVGLSKIKPFLASGPGLWEVDSNHH